MRILVASTHRPTRRAEFVRRAANVVTFELLASLAAQPHTEVGYVNVVLGATDEGGMDEVRPDLEAAGVRVLEPLTITLPHAARSLAARVRALLAPGIVDFYPAYAARGAAANVVTGWQADAVLIPWSEVLTALFSDAPAAVRYAYYGNPDPKGRTAQQALRHQFGCARGRLAELAEWVKIRQLERCHLQVLRRYDLVGDVASNDAQYYRDRGLNAFYVRNLWYDCLGDEVHAVKQRRESAAHQVIGSIGRLSATANTFGLHIIAEQYVPALRARLGAGNFQVSILGGGQAVPPVDAALRAHPEVALRGFVPDIDAELQQAKVFLVANNAGPYKVGHTRFLHAWSLGCCVVGHVDATLSMPEITHGHNALLGRDAEEMAELTGRAMADAALRARIARNGYDTFRTLFQAQPVAEMIVGDIARALNSRTPPAQATARRAA